MLSLLSLLLLLLASSSSVVFFVDAYIPAVPTNATSGDQSIVLELRWNNGEYRTSLTRQLLADPVDNTTTPIPSQNRIARGVLVHFNESNSAQPPVTLLPWIAMISCDTNGTVFSDTDDIFTLARDSGAQAALLYSVTAQGCRINQDYLMPKFDKPIDVYTTNSLQDAKLINNQFTNVDTGGYYFNSKLMNDSALAIETLINATSFLINNVTIIVSTVSDPQTAAADPTPSSSYGIDTNVSAPANTNTMLAASYLATLSSPSDLTSSPTPASSLSDLVPTLTSPSTSVTSVVSAARLRKRFTTSTTITPAAAAPTKTSTSFLVAIMASNLITVSNSTTSVPASASSSSSSGSSSTNVATTILYSLTAFVSLMFIIVVVSGAIRAMRHPERYGPRSSGIGEDGRMGEYRSRTTGLTRAILDTFPVVKFRKSANDDETVMNPTVARGSSIEDVSDSGWIGKPLSRSSAGHENVHGIPMEELDSRPSDVQRTSSQSQDPSSPPRSISSAGLASSALSASTASIPASLRLETSAVPFLASPSSSPALASSPDPSSLLPTPVSPTLAIDPLTVNNEQSCPICVEEFLANDELRVLPCDEKHQFHRACIDPWLLKMSSMCPLCRLDLGQGRRGGGENDLGGEWGEDEEGEEEERRERQVISHLRDMLPGSSSSRRERSNGSGSIDGSTTANRSSSSDPHSSPALEEGDGNRDGSGSSSSRFFKYVASKRRAIAGRRRRGAAFSGGSGGTSMPATPTIPPIRESSAEQDEESEQGVHARRS